MEELADCEVALRRALQEMGGSPSDDSQPTSGDLLEELAVNFLLYVALVLITYLVVKLYIESSPDNPLFDEEVSYNRVPSTQSGVDLGPPRDTSLPTNRPAVRRSLIDFDLEDEIPTSRNQVWRKLMILGVSLNVTFVTWGVLQERILKMEYGQGVFFTYSYGLVFTNRFLGLLLSSVFMYYTRPTWSKAMAYEYSLPSVSNMLSSWCQYEALKFVTFPTQVLSKAFKLAPIMMMGKILGNKEYPLYDYVVAGLTGLGITLFIVSAEGIDLGTDSFGQKGAFGSGLMLLSLFLMFDSFTSQWQSRMFTKHRDLSPIQMMFVMNAFSTIFSLITLIHMNELMPFFTFVVEHPEIHLHFIAFSICSTVGQLLIFHTIRSFGAVVFAIIMTVRIALSILASCIIYHHPVTQMGMLGLVIVFGAVGYRIQRQLEGKRVLTWHGMDDSKAPELFREWHTHLDF